MSTTSTTSGGAFYGTAVDLRGWARKASTSYGEALSQLAEIPVGDPAGRGAKQAHANNLILQVVGFEIAAALCCVAQAIEDHNGPRYKPPTPPPSDD